MIATSANIPIGNRRNNYFLGQILSKWINPKLNPLFLVDLPSLPNNLLGISRILLVIKISMRLGILSRMLYMINIRKSQEHKLQPTLNQSLKDQTNLIGPIPLISKMEFPYWIPKNLRGLYHLRIKEGSWRNLLLLTPWVQLIKV